MDFTWVLPLADSWDMHGDFDSGWWIVMMVGMVVFWGAIILGIVWLVRGGFERSGRDRRETPTEILDRRARRRRHLCRGLPPAAGGHRGGGSPAVAPIEYADNGRRHRVRIGDFVEMEVEDFVPPQNPEGEPFKLMNIIHPGNSTLSIAPTTTSRFKGFGHEFSFEGKYGHSSSFSWAPQKATRSKKTFGQGDGVVLPGRDPRDPDAIGFSSSSLASAASAVTPIARPGRGSSSRVKGAPQSAVATHRRRRSPPSRSAASERGLLDDGARGAPRRMRRRLTWATTGVTVGPNIAKVAREAARAGDV